MSASPRGRPIPGRMRTVGQGGPSKSLTPDAVAMMTATKQAIDSPTVAATMKARMRSPR